jgi:hypothetical protein
VHAYGLFLAFSGLCGRSGGRQIRWDRFSVDSGRMSGRNIGFDVDLCLPWTRRDAAGHAVTSKSLAVSAVMGEKRNDFWRQAAAREPS